jgi:hypothetical protein
MAAWFNDDDAPRDARQAWSDHLAGLGCDPHFVRVVWAYVWRCRAVSPSPDVFWLSWLGPVSALPAELPAPSSLRDLTATASRAEAPPFRVLAHAGATG